MGKRVVISIFAAVMMFLWAYNVHAEMDGCMGKPGDGMHEDGPPAPFRMMFRDREMMDGPFPEMPEYRLLMHLHGFGLDENQKQEIRKIVNELMKNTVLMQSDVQIAMLEMKDILDKDPVDMKAVESKLKKMESLITALKLSHIRALEEVKAKLNPDQREKLREMLSMGPMMGGNMHDMPEVH